MTSFRNACFQMFEEWLDCYQEILAAMAEVY
jgi:hypothetical protein